MTTTTRPWRLACVDCDKTYPPLEIRYRCDCGGTLDVIHDRRPPIDPGVFTRRWSGREPADRSGVWRYRELVLPLSPSEIVTRMEGSTNLYSSPRLDAYCGVEGLVLKHEGENPTGSFKDRGMTVAMSVASLLGARAVACASTGNTSASLASYAAVAGIPAFVFIPGGKIAYGKLSQALAYGATTIQIDGDFDDAMRIVQRVCDDESVYLVNSINPYRIEGQKAIGFELLDQLGWEVPDWIVLPGGNLGNSSAIAKGMVELYNLGVIDRLPRIAIVQARGANPLYRAFSTGLSTVDPLPNADTIATAIRIGAPVSWRKCLRGIDACKGVVTDADDAEILDAKAMVDAAGIGAEPASCATVAGLRRLVREGVIKPGERIAGILTGHLLKDPDVVVNYHKRELEGVDARYANELVSLPADEETIIAHIRGKLT
ncbi:MAG: threonine synthase [Phycisphaerae bacterium]|nr:threonine synthase [Phycisphaerae bacterium]